MKPTNSIYIISLLERKYEWNILVNLFGFLTNMSKNIDLNRLDMILGYCCPNLLTWSGLNFSFLIYFGVFFTLKSI